MALLSADQIVVQFGGLRALSDAQIEVEQGRVTGLIGPNGAGKTTLFNVITGLQPPTSGRVTLNDVDITGRSPYKRARMGIARTFQKLEAFNSLSALDNVLVAAEARPRSSRANSDSRAEAMALLDRVGIADLANFMVGTLPTGTARLIELARALATKPKVLLLDEPSSGLNEEETFEMAVILRELVADGLGVLLVEHDMAFVMGTCEYLYVLDFGQIIATGTPTEIQHNPAVQAAYLGTEIEGAA